jgi:HEAT repeat protein
MWSLEDPPKALLAIGDAALVRLLDAPDSAFWPTEMEWRDFGVNRSRAIAVLAKSNLEGVLAAMKERKWTDAAIACSGIGLVDDARVVPLLTRAFEGATPDVRAHLVDFLALQSDPIAIEALTRALKDRSSSVRDAAKAALAAPPKRRRLEHGA